MIVIDVWVDLGSTKLDAVYHYDATGFNVAVGSRVKVSFNNREIVGVISKINDFNASKKIIEESTYEIKPIITLIDEVPMITDEQLSLAKELAYQNVTSVISCLNVMVPRFLSTQKAPNLNEAHYKVIVREVDLPLKQKEAYQYLLKEKVVLRSKFNKLYPSVANPLTNKGLIELVYRKPMIEKEVRDIEKPPLLTNDQKLALNEIEKNKSKPILLFGVTGSGKTELYLNLAQDIINESKQVLILVPEISLTPLMIKRFKRRFHNQVAIYHSRLSLKEKMVQFELVKNNDIKIIVGTRSAVFLPFQALGLIVMDEEHDYSYKQAETPRYHCRDVVLLRAKYHQAQVILGSATPSFESYARALKDVYYLVKLPSRINESQLDCKIIDTRAALMSGQSNILTNEMISALKKRLDRKEQSLLFLNRRGHSPLLKCDNCQHVILCDDCDIALNYHETNQLLICHICGKTKPLVKVCPVCQSDEMSFYGFGTQKVVSELKKHFPTAKIIRMDLDSVASAGSHQKILNKFESEGDILIGTQMIAKGLDYPNITLVGILNGDAYLIKDDFRSVETAFALLVQASGRSGRGEKQGEVLIQAYNPGHYALKLACNSDYDKFFRYEMKYRKIGQYPPYTFLASITLYCKNESLLDTASYKIKESLLSYNINVLGPSQLMKQKTHYRQRLTIKSKDLNYLLKILHKHFEVWQNINSQVLVVVDVNPLIWG